MPCVSQGSAEVRTAGDALALVVPLLKVAAPDPEGRAGPRPVLVVSDFDGTLAELDLDPWAARILPLARRSLRRLATLDGVRVVLLSGRTAADLAGRVRVGGARYLGNHGLERGDLARGAPAERLRLAGSAAGPADGSVARALADGVPRLVPEAWLIVEPKLPAVAFHFRGAPDVPAARLRVREAVERLDPQELLVRHQGLRVLELRPPGATGKGEAMRGLIDELRPRVAFMLGDDRNDARAFQTLRAARAAGELDGLAIAVAAHADVLPDVAPHADLLLASPVEAARFLSGLARLLEAQ